MPIRPTQSAAHDEPDGLGLPEWAGRFVVERTLAHQPGVMTVYAGRDTRRQVAVVVRVLPWIAEGTIQARAFDDAVSMRRRIDHPGLAPVLDAGRGAQGAWVATAPGDETLADLLARDGVLGAEDSIAVLSPVAEALDLAHAHGMVCDSLTPSDVWVITEPGGRVRGMLADVGPSWPAKLRPGRLLGEVDELAPEEIRGAAPSPSSNIYALGALLVRCLTGEPPFRAGSRAATLSAHLESPPPRVSERFDGRATGLDDVIASALAKEPGARPASAVTLVADAAGRLGLEGLAPVAPEPRAAAPATAPSPVGLPAAKPRAGRRTGWPVLTALLVPAAILIALAGYLVVRPDGSRQRPAARPPAADSRPAEALAASATLRPPTSSGGSDGPTGAVRVTGGDGRYVMTIAGAGLPPESTDPVQAYTVWLVGPGRRALRLGAVVPAVGSSGRFVNHRTLPAGASRYRRLMVTLETSLGNRPAGPTVLAGRVKLP
jgi:hypothetical protein